jgi:acyl-CoA reductase-like NAD-dependent aldehyde dehydrogenase
MSNLKNDQMFISGEWTESESKKRFESISPVMGEVLGVFQKAYVRMCDAPL